VLNIRRIEDIESPLNTLDRPAAENGKYLGILDNIDPVVHHSREKSQCPPD
jgi:hypothetical protein